MHVSSDHLFQLDLLNRAVIKQVIMIPAIAAEEIINAFFHRCMKSQHTIQPEHPAFLCGIKQDLIPIKLNIIIIVCEIKR